MKFKKLTTLLVTVILLMIPGLASASAGETIVLHAAGDVTNTLFSWPMLLLIGGGALSGGLSKIDKDVQSHFTHSHLGKIDSIIDDAGPAYILDPAAAAVWGIGKLIKDDDVAFTGENLFEALIFTQALTAWTKLVADRQRPNGGKWGFPSDHTAEAFSVATVLAALHGPYAGVPAYLIAGFVGFSRIDSNAHYLSDVVMGAVIGTAVGWGVTRFHKKERASRFTVLPMATNRTLGVSLFYSF
ncbi:MAG: phosphatase PAP2 family protein [bacterium]